MSASEGVNNVSKFHIKVAQLAGNDERPGLSKHITQLDLTNKNKQDRLSKENTALAVWEVAFAVLFAIAAAGALTFFICTPLSSAAVNYATGAVLSALALGLIALGIWKYYHTQKLNKEVEEKFDAEVNGDVPEKVILRDMHKDNVDNIQGALEQFSADQRKGFFQYIYDEYYPVLEDGDVTEPQPLTDEQKKVISVLAKFPQTLARIDIPEMKREFALEILKNIESDVHEEYIAKLFQCVGEAKPEEAAIFARHPKAIAAREIVKGQVSKDLQAILTAMDDGERAIFLQKITDEKLNTVAIRSCVRLCVDLSLTDQFIELISTGEREDEKAKANYEKARLLLKQLGRWPVEMAERIYLSQDEDLLEKRNFINAAHAEMNPEAKAAFVKHAVEHLSKDHDCADWINYYVEGKIGMLPLPTMLIYIQRPLEMARAMKKINNGDAMQRTNAILDGMSTEQWVAFLEAEKQVSRETFAERVVGLGHISKENRVAYFSKHPEDFKTYILDTKRLNQDEKLVLAIQILEQMGERAEEIIASGAFKGSFITGYDVFNTFTNKLVELTQGEVTPERNKLIARFRHAAQWKDAQGMHLGKVKMDAPGGRWSKFYELAGDTPEDKGVWKPKQG